MPKNINGIDVSECKYYIQDYQRANNIEGRYEHCKDVCELNGDNYFYCKMNKDCYYKQLKRLQEENKRLQMLSCANCGEKYLSPDGAELYEKNVQLQKELEQLNKKCYETFKMLKHEYDGRQKDNEQWFTRCTENHNEDSKVIEIYKQALEKIRDIAQIHQYFNPELLEIKGDIGRIQDLKMTEIFKKCNEVLNDRD